MVFLIFTAKIMFGSYSIKLQKAAQNMSCVGNNVDQHLGVLLCVQRHHFEVLLDAAHWGRIVVDGMALMKVPFSIQYMPLKCA